MPPTSEPGRVAIVDSHVDLDEPASRLLMPTVEQGPFLPFDRFAETMSATEDSSGPHSHLAEEVVTFVLEGSVRHTDGRGATVDLGPGSVLLLTAHEEVRHELTAVPGPDGRKARWLSLVLRLPWHTEPPPTSLQIKDAGETEEGLDGTRRRPVVGARARADSSMGLEALDLEFTRDTEVRLQIGSGRRAIAYIVQGTGRIEKTPVDAGRGALLDHVGSLTIGGTRGLRLFVASVPVVGEGQRDESVEGRLTGADYPGVDDL